MDYLKLLKNSLEYLKKNDDDDDLSPFEFISDNIFDFTIYDGELSEEMGEKALEVCVAITNRKTFDYIKSGEKYKNYINMINMPFFKDRIEWGTSIRGAWWDYCVSEKITLESCGLFDGDTQILNLSFDGDQWTKFIEAMVEFTKDN